MHAPSRYAFLLISMLLGNTCQAVYTYYNISGANDASINDPYYQQVASNSEHFELLEEYQRKRGYVSLSGAFQHQSNNNYLLFSIFDNDSFWCITSFDEYTVYINGMCRGFYWNVPTFTYNGISQNVTFERIDLESPIEFPIFTPINSSTNTSTNFTPKRYSNVVQMMVGVLIIIVLIIFALLKFSVNVKDDEQPFVHSIMLHETECTVTNNIQLTDELAV
eukprot:17855_1